VSFLKTTMENGEFDGGSPIRFASFSNLAPVLIDGQHRLHAISLMPSDYKLQVTVITSRCDTPEEVAQIYARIDRGRSRSLVDALQALGYFSESNGLSRAQSAAVLACSPLFETHLRTISINGFSYASRSAEHRAEVMGPWMDASRQFYGAISKSNFGNSRLFYNRQVVVVGLATFKEPDAAERAEDFWQVMAEDSGLDALDPRKICLEFVRSQTGGGRGSATRRGQGRSHVVGYLAQGVTMCWNAYYRGTGRNLPCAGPGPQGTAADPRHHVCQAGRARNPHSVDSRCPTRERSEGLFRTHLKKRSGAQPQSGSGLTNADPSQGLFVSPAGK